MYPTVHTSINNNNNSNNIIRNIVMIFQYKFITRFDTYRNTWGIDSIKSNVEEQKRSFSGLPTHDFIDYIGNKCPTEQLSGELKADVLFSISDGAC